MSIGIIIKIPVMFDDSLPIGYGESTAVYRRPDWYTYSLIVHRYINY